MIYGFKFGGLKDVAKPLGEILCDHLRRVGLKADVIVPIPLGKKRLRQRGYNQSEILAYEVSKKTGIPICHALKRVIETKPQAELPREERASNVENCFGATGETVKGKTILLLDDVTTSGSTMTQAASVLKTCGAKKIYALALSKA